MSDPTKGKIILSDEQWDALIEQLNADSNTNPKLINLLSDNRAPWKAVEDDHKDCAYQPHRDEYWSSRSDFHRVGHS